MIVFSNRMKHHKNQTHVAKALLPGIKGRVLKCGSHVVSKLCAQDTPPVLQKWY